ncbi:hypothetical protein K466DRAFT_568482 [Polyporus arcularius HHB13444]|uniref:Uncharacterized protein n=1 Tax=Polyporus arcularius HHB13444 TaxID=1314778 RepID=A0A5C3NYN3_9APHY|nr:hypothetical protein K466DRAFT_568482 [Polyporus arcularius HHB13444]
MARSQTSNELPSVALSCASDDMERMERNVKPETGHRSGPVDRLHVCRYTGGAIRETSCRVFLVQYAARGNVLKRMIRKLLSRADPKYIRLVVEEDIVGDPIKEYIRHLDLDLPGYSRDAADLCCGGIILSGTYTGGFLEERVQGLQRPIRFPGITDLRGSGTWAEYLESSLDIMLDLYGMEEELKPHREQAVNYLSEIMAEAEDWARDAECPQTAVYTMCEKRLRVNVREVKPGCWVPPVSRPPNPSGE